MSDTIDIDNIRFAFTESDYFQREVERQKAEYERRLLRRIDDGSHRCIKDQKLGDRKRYCNEKEKNECITDHMSKAKWVVR